MFTVLLIIIYLAFISLGLPDSLLGSAWPAMYGDLGANLSAAGILAMIVSGGTIVSSFFSGKVIRRFGTGKVTLVSVAMTAAALFGFANMSSFGGLCLMAIPLGLGAGSVDAALNHFVALHYKANHMSWLHCFWGVGATMGPIIMSYFIGQTNDWQQGYRSIAYIQFSLVAVLLMTLPLWKKIGKITVDEEAEQISEEKNVLRIPGVKLVLISFTCYCAVEATAGLWGSSYLVNYKGLSVDAAARCIALFYGGITVGRLISGFLTLKLSNQQLIRSGQLICMIGILCMILPLPIYFSMIGLVLIGLGCAPIYPCMLHETPVRFGKAASQSIMGVQMAFAYIGSTFMPPLAGLIASKTSFIALPYFLLVCVAVMFIGSEKVNHFIKDSAGQEVL